MSVLGVYLDHVRRIRSSGQAVPETSYYPALAELLDAVGRTLHPRVQVVINPSNIGAGIPDGGLFTAEQALRKDQTLGTGAPPARGVVEVKSPSQDIRTVVGSEQVARYASRYGRVLVTTLRAFAVLDPEMAGPPMSFEVAANEGDFWSTPRRQLVSERGDAFEDFLKRALSGRAPVKEPRDLAQQLASYAREARRRIERTPLDHLQSIRDALKEALGLDFTGDRADHFFRSTLIQTVFYGAFSAWVLWIQEQPPEDEAFEWRTSAWRLRVPVVRALFERIVTPTRLDALDLVDVMDWAGDVFNRVDRERFFERFSEDSAVAYFYEPFLEEFDPDLRKDLGVWYTPPEIVKYMVERIDQTLRVELNRPDGLADPNVYVLDPCCGTGAYLVAVLERIAQTIANHGDQDLLAANLKEAATTRLFGFEILPAPFVVAHLQLGLKLQDWGVPLATDGTERLPVFLTNALTGWIPEEGAEQIIGFPELGQERDASAEVKTSKPILVVLGNPPYNGFAGTTPIEEQGLVNAYKEGLDAWGITKNYLDDLYVRFFRVAERMIADHTGTGLFSYISNFSYLSEQTYVVMRQHLLESFNEVWVDCMNGVSRETGKRTPSGEPDPSVFSTPYNREGIRKGTAISLFVRTSDDTEPATVRFRHHWGSEKVPRLLQDPVDQDDYQLAEPNDQNRYSFRPANVNPNYYSWPLVSTLAHSAPSLGLNDNRNQGTHAMVRHEIAERMRAYFDKSRTDEEFRSVGAELMAPAAGYEPSEVRRNLLELTEFDDQKIVPFEFKPLDVRFAYLEDGANLWNRIRPPLLAQAWDGNRFYQARRSATNPEGAAFYASRSIGDQHVMQADAYFFPLLLRTGQGASSEAAHEQGALFGEREMPSAPILANISDEVRTYLRHLGMEGLQERERAELLWRHVLAIGFSPMYLAENRDGIRHDWPRIPMPDSATQLERSAALGRIVEQALDVYQRITELDLDLPDRFLQWFGRFRTDTGLAIGAHESDFTIQGGWGYIGARGATMPGTGNTSDQELSEEDRQILCEGLRALGSPTADATEVFGPRVVVVHLNDHLELRNVPKRVWEYNIGGYQVLKKWLSYREHRVLRRSLEATEAGNYRDLVRRVGLLVALSPSLDENYARITSNTASWDT